MEKGEICVSRVTVTMVVASKWTPVASLFAWTLTCIVGCKLLAPRSTLVDYSFFSVLVCKSLPLGRKGRAEHRSPC